MNLASYAAKHHAEICDWSQSWNAGAAARGWQCLAVFTQDEECEPDFLLIKSPSWPNYQVRDIASDMTSGHMLTDAQLKQWIRTHRQTPC